MKIEIIQHYDKSDVDCGSDYISVDVKIDGEVVETYGDYYHEKGETRAESFVEGVKWALKDKNIYLEKLAVADAEGY